MAVTFNPPPGWPDAPSRWAPPDGWKPDPSWPSMPTGWQLFQPLPRFNSSVRRGVALVVAGVAWSIIATAIGASNQAGGWAGVLLWLGVVLIGFGVFVRVRSVREARRYEARIRS